MACFAKIKELDLAMLGTQTASIFTLRFAENAESNVPKWIRSEAQTLHIVFVTEYYFGNYYKLLSEIYKLNKPGNWNEEFKVFYGRR